MRHILATITNSPYGFGGVSTWLERITIGLPAYGWHVTTVTHALDEAHLADWKTMHPALDLQPIYGRYTRLNQISFALEQYLDRVKPNVVIVNGSYWMLPSLQRRKRRGDNLRVIGVCHADENGYYNPLVFYRESFDHIIGVSQTCYATLLERGCPPARTSILPYGVPCLAQLPQRPSRGPLRLAYVGRLVQSQKRILDFVPLIAELNARRVNYRLDFYGTGAEEKMLREQVQAIDQDKRVFFHGWIPAAQVAQTVWQNADIFLLVSAYEGLAISMLEAMGYGVVPIVSRVASGVAQVIREGETGYTFKIGDVVRCAELIAMLDREREQLVRLSQATWEFVRQEYSIETHTQRLASILDKVMREPAQLTPASYMGVTSHPLAQLVPGWAIVLARRYLKRGNPINEGYTTFP